MAKTRVLVVEDSPTVRAHLTAILEAEPDVELVGAAADGRQAIDMCQKLRPDVVTMDMMLPVMSGLAATEYIMAHCPTPILVVSSSFNRGELMKMYDALAAGAVDVLEKPDGRELPGEWERRFLSTLKIVSRIRVVTHHRARLRNYDHVDRPPQARAAMPAGPVDVVAMGASTGGPSAIVDVLRSIPVGMMTPILLVLHINPQFGAAFADWLDAQTPRRAGFARDGDRVADGAGRVLMAPPDQHLVVRDGRIRLTNDPERHSCRPSVDVLFESVAHEFGDAAVGCLLTGMGRDGASGLLAMRQAGAVTIAQDQATSTVYGMPRAAAEMGAAVRILPLPEIGPAIGDLTRVMERRA